MKLVEHASKVIKIAYLRYRLKKTEEQYAELKNLEARKAKEKKSNVKKQNFKKNAANKEKIKDLTD